MIELLVVVAIIAVLAALLLPALGKARSLSHRTVDVNDTRQISTGMLMYTTDADGFFPLDEYNYALDTPVIGTNLIWRDWANYRQFDLRPVARDYGFIASTGHANSSATSWDDPGNTGFSNGFGTRLQWTRRFHPTAAYGDLVGTDRLAAAPNRVTVGDPEHVIVGTFLVRDPSGIYQGAYVPGATVQPLSGNPSFQIHAGVQPGSMVGSAFDGSIGVIRADQGIAVTKSNGWQQSYYQVAK